MNLLFVCSQNKWRSPTAERIYNRVPLINARSAGTSRKAKHHISVQDINWADFIFVMEDKHLSRLRADFPALIKEKRTYVLHIPDEYRYMDADLVDLLYELVDPVINAL